MTTIDDFTKALKQHVKTSSATTKAFSLLVQDLAPVIGYEEAQRLLDIIIESQEGEDVAV